MHIILFEYARFMMVLSLIHPNTCGFSKVIAWQLAKSTQSKATRLDGEGHPFNVHTPLWTRSIKFEPQRKKDQSADTNTPTEINKFFPYPSEKNAKIK